MANAPAWTADIRRVKARPAPEPDMWRANFLELRHRYVKVIRSNIQLQSKISWQRKKQSQEPRYPKTRPATENQYDEETQDIVSMMAKNVEDW